MFKVDDLVRYKDSERTTQTMRVLEVHERWLLVCAEAQHDNELLGDEKTVMVADVEPAE